MLETIEPGAAAAVFRDLADLQERHGWSGSRMADELDVSPAYWSMLVRGVKPFTLEFGERIVRRFPELRVSVNAALAARGVAIV